MTGVVLLAFSLAAASFHALEPDHGWVEFSREPSIRGGPSIKIFLVLEEKNRVRYLDEIGATGSRKLTWRRLRARAGSS